MRHDVRQHLPRMRPTGNRPAPFQRFTRRKRPFSHSGKPAAGRLGRHLPHPRDPRPRASVRSAMASTSGRRPAAVAEENRGHASPMAGSGRCAPAPSSRRPTGRTGRCSRTYRRSTTANAGTAARPALRGSTGRRGSAPCRPAPGDAGYGGGDRDVPSSSQRRYEIRTARTPARIFTAAPGALGRAPGWGRLAKPLAGAHLAAAYPRPGIVRRDAATLPPQTSAGGFVSVTLTLPLIQAGACRLLRIFFVY